MLSSDTRFGPTPEERHKGRVSKGEQTEVGSFHSSRRGPRPAAPQGEVFSLLRGLDAETIGQRKQVLSLFGQGAAANAAESRHDGLDVHGAQATGHPHRSRRRAARALLDARGNLAERQAGRPRRRRTRRRRRSPSRRGSSKVGTLGGTGDGRVTAKAVSRPSRTSGSRARRIVEHHRDGAVHQVGIGQRRAPCRARRSSRCRPEARTAW